MKTNKAILYLGITLLIGSLFSSFYFSNELESEIYRLQTVEDKNNKLENQINERSEQIVENTTPSKKATSEREFAVNKSGKWFMGINEKERESTLKEIVNSRYKSAQKSDREGKLEEALEEYLWCFDIGMIESPSHSKVRMSSLLKRIVGLGMRHPAALEALAERRNQFEKVYIDGKEDNFDFIEINNQLGEELRNLSVLDQLLKEPQSDARRLKLASRIFDLLADEARYTDAATARPYPIMLMQCESEVMSAKKGIRTTFQGSNKENARTRFYQTALNIETLAALNEIEQAADLIGRVVAYDSSPETVAVLESRLERVGRVDLLKAMTN